MSYSDVFIPPGLAPAGSRNIFSAASAPVSPLTGDLWYNTTSKQVNVYDGSSWIPVSTASTPTLPPLPTPNNQGDFLVATSATTWGPNSADGGRY